MGHHASLHLPPPRFRYKVDNYEPCSLTTWDMWEADYGPEVAFYVAPWSQVGNGASVTICLILIPHQAWSCMVNVSLLRE